MCIYTNLSIENRKKSFKIKGLSHLLLLLKLDEIEVGKYCQIYKLFETSSRTAKNQRLILSKFKR